MLLSYLVPAIGLGIGIWMLMWLLWELNVRSKARKRWFVGLVTILMAPAIVPTEIIAVTFIPNGVLLLLGVPFQPVQFVKIGLPSFVVTGVVAWMVARYLLSNKSRRDVA